MASYCAHSAHTGVPGLSSRRVSTSRVQPRPLRPACRDLSSETLKARQWPSVRCSAVAGDGLGRSAEDFDKLLDGCIEKCDLVDSFCRAAVQQHAWPRENVRSYMEPPTINSSKVAAAAARATFPAWIELMQSVDSTDVIDWSDAENDGWGVAAEQHSSGNSTCSSSNGSSSPQPPAAAAAVAGATGARGGLWSGTGGCLSSSSSRLVGVWGSSCSRRGVGARAVVVRAAPTGKQVDTESDESPHYEGADSDTLYPPGSLEMDDPGHPTDIAQPDLQGKVLRPEAKPYMNIQGGRWVAPSRAQAEHMMQSLSNMGPDEGV